MIKVSFESVGRENKRWSVLMQTISDEALEDEIRRNKALLSPRLSFEFDEKTGVGEIIANNFVVGIYRAEFVDVHKASVSVFQLTKHSFYAARSLGEAVDCRHQTGVSMFELLEPNHAGLISPEFLDDMLIELDDGIVLTFRQAVDQAIQLGDIPCCITEDHNKST